MGGEAPQSPSRGRPALFYARAAGTRSMRLSAKLRTWQSESTGRGTYDLRSGTLTSRKRSQPLLQEPL
eukprot:4691622-Alexandrium_andersonii.AAC.1